jgi:hypothetical protein
MPAILLFAPFVAGLLFLVLALSPKPVAPARLRPGERPRARIPPGRLRAIVVRLLGEMGFRIEPDPVHGSPDDRSQRLVAVHQGPWAETRHIVFIEASPDADRVEPTTVLELAEQVKSEPGAVGLLITPYEVDRSATAGIEGRIEIIDGTALRALVARELPHLLVVLDEHGIGGQTAPTRPPVPAHGAAGSWSP